MSFLRLDLRAFFLTALPRLAESFLPRFDFDFLARGIVTSVGGMTAYPIERPIISNYFYLYLYLFSTPLYPAVAYQPPRRQWRGGWFGKTLTVRANVWSHARGGQSAEVGV